MPNEPGRVPWERWDGETTKAYSAFALYRDLLAHRTTEKVAFAIAAERHPKEAKTVDDPRKIPGVRSIHRELQRYSSKFSWVERAEAYDDYLERKWRAQREDRIAMAEEEESRLASTMIYELTRRVIGDRRLGTPEGEEVKKFDPRKIEEREIPAMLEKLVKVRRLSSGQPTDVLRGNFSISMREVSDLFRDTYDILARHIPEERIDRAQAELDSYLATRRLPWGA